jgi:hypothetical protein
MLSITDLQTKNLRIWNIVMGFLHLIQGVFMWFISNDTSFQTYLNLPSPDLATRSLPLKAEDFIEVNLGQAIAGFLLFSAVAHLVTVLPGIFSWYKKNLEKEMNLIRWWEYALSSSLMVVVIAALCGITDGSILILLFGINACMNLFGAVMEKHNSALKELKGEEYKTDWTAFNYGVLAGILPWIIMGIYFFTAIDRAGEQVPDFVYWIFPTLFVFFNLFAINMFMQYKKIGPWKNYLFGEKVYIILSLAAKTTLAWIIWGGTLR